MSTSIVLEVFVVEIFPTALLMRNFNILNENLLLTTYSSSVRFFVSGVVQKPAGKVAQARTQRDERCGGGGCRLQERIRLAVQRSDAAVHGHRLAVLFVLDVQQLGQGAESPGRQELPLEPQLGGATVCRRADQRAQHQLLQRGRRRRQRVADADGGRHGLQPELAAGAVSVRRRHVALRVPRRRGVLVHELEHRLAAPQGQAALVRLRRLLAGAQPPLGRLQLQPLGLPVRAAHGRRQSPLRIALGGRRRRRRPSLRVNPLTRHTETLLVRSYVGDLRHLSASPESAGRQQLAMANDVHVFG